MAATRTSGSTVVGPSKSPTPTEVSSSSSSPSPSSHRSSPAHQSIRTHEHQPSLPSLSPVPNQKPQLPFHRDSFSLKNVELIRTVGTGTFGRVLAVREKATGRHYALKVLSIEAVVRLRQSEHVLCEKEILARVSHPFIVSLFWTHRDVKFLYLLLEFVCGGELFSYLRAAGTFPAPTAHFYTCEIATCVAYLHSQQIAYRDLKPENILLDAEGHVKLTDFGFAKTIEDRTYTMCGTPEYLAPGEAMVNTAMLTWGSPSNAELGKVLQGKGYNKSVDWWALGILVYEMLIGCPPFYDDSPIHIYQKILTSKLEFPREGNLDPYAKDLIKKLLAPDRTKRLGNLKNGSEDVLRHKWFKNVDWDLVVSKSVPVPIRPTVSHAGDTRCYERYEEQDWKKVPVAPAKALDYFHDF